MSYLLGTEAWLYVFTSPQAYPPPGSFAERLRAAEAIREWSESIRDDLIFMSIVTYGEICVIHNGAQNNLQLHYELTEILNKHQAEPKAKRVLDLTKEDMAHWARIYAVLDDDPDLKLEDSFALAQALHKGFTYVSQRTDTLTELENVGLSFLDPEEWLAQQNPQ